MDVFAFINEVRNIKGTKAKEEFIRVNHNEYFLEMLKWAFDWTKTLGITAETCESTFCPQTDCEMESAFDHLGDTVSKLNDRIVTGDAARHYLKANLSNFAPFQQEILVDFLNKKPRLGVAETMVYKLFPNLIPKWNGCMLAKKWEGEELKFPLHIEPKIDGMRCLIVMGENGATAYTREGHELPQVQFICNQIVEALREAGSTPLYVFDDELFTKDWNTTLKLAKTEKDIDRSELIFHCFDAILRTEWEVGYSNRKIGEYRDELIQIVRGRPNIKAVPRHLVYNLEEMNAFYDEYLQDGYEGIMIKRRDGRYECKRSSDWLKYKPETTADYPIVGTFEGKGKFRDTLGGLVLDKGNGVELGVGSGFTDAIRANLWGSRDNLAGKMCEVKFQPGRDGAAEFAVFVRIREDL